MTDAAEAYAAHLAEKGNTANPRAVFRLGVLRARSMSAAEQAAGLELLERVAAAADQPYRFAAQSLLDLARRVDGLEGELDDVSRQLEALKRIDLERSRSRRHN